MTELRQALILAGGKGTRLRPYTTVVPKPLMPVGDHPILEIVLRQLARAGVQEAILAVGHMGKLLEAFFQDGERLGLAVSYTYEEEPLGTAGAIGLALDRLRGDFLVMNGDLLTTLDYRKLHAAHRDAKAAATIALHTREVKIDFGVIETTPESRLGRYVEKPTYTFDVSMGINVFSADAVKRHMTPGERIDIPDLMTRLKERGEVVHCHRDPCFWLDIGRLDDYEAATKAFEARSAEFLAGPPP